MKHHHDTTHQGLTPDQPQCCARCSRSGLDVKPHLLQHYAELARLLAREILDEEVGGLCGERYSRHKPLDGRYRRWGTNPGSIAIAEERVPIEVPRVRDVEPLSATRQVPVVITLASHEQIAELRANESLSIFSNAPWSGPAMMPTPKAAC